MLLGSTCRHVRQGNALRFCERNTQSPANEYILCSIQIAPQNTHRKDISELNIDAAWEYMHAQELNRSLFMPYIINLGNSVKPETFELAVNFLDRDRTDEGLQKPCADPASGRSCRCRYRCRYFTDHQRIR